MKPGAPFPTYQTGARERAWGHRPGYPDRGVDVQQPRLVEWTDDPGAPPAEAQPGPDWPAALSMDEWWEQCDVVRRRLARQPRQAKVPVAAMIRAYEQATGWCVCCD